MPEKAGRQPGGPDPESVACEALVVGMTLVPGFCSRNRSFALFENPAVRRAKRRAALLRGIVRQLAGAHGRVEGPIVARRGDGFELCYGVPGLRMGRRSSLTETELACLRLLATRGGVPGLAATEDDRARVDAALLLLA